MATFFKKSKIILCLVVFIAPLISAASSPLTILPANNGGKQIVFMVNGPDLMLTDVKISGTNQNNEQATWEKHNGGGFRVAYTKDWWWVENFVQIDFTVQESASQTSYSRTCLIDALEQTSDSPRVEIIYYKDQGCDGGEAGNARNPIADPFKQKTRQIKDAFKIIGSYLTDFDTQVFIETFLYMEINATSCAVAVGTAFSVGGPSFAAAAAGVTTACERTGEKILKTFFVQP